MFFQTLSEDYEDATENFTFPFVTKLGPIAFSHSWSHVHITHGPAGRTTGLHTFRCTYIPTLINRSLLLSTSIWFLARQRHCLVGRPWPLERYNNIEKVEFLDGREPLPRTTTARSRRIDSTQLSIVSSKLFNCYSKKMTSNYLSGESASIL